VLTINSLDQALKDLDAKNGVRKELQLTLDPQRERQRQLRSDDVYKTRPELTELTHAQMSTASAVVLSLAVVDEYADKAARMGEKGDAERAYLRMREVYRSLPFSVAISHRKLLKKIAAFYTRNEEPLQAEAYLLECSRLCDNPSIVDEEVWSHLAQLSPESSKELNRGLEMVSNRQITLQAGQFAFPPLHRILRSGYISAAPSRTFGMESSSDITGSPPLHTAITGNLPAAFDMIQNCTEEVLESRDMYLRTPMFLAALFMAEEIGMALMIRYLARPIQIRQRLVGARDHLGQTILAIAILSGCSFEFIKALVENCATVDPDPTQNVLSPLQAAASQGKKDVVILLLDHGAQDSSIYLGELSASTLARLERHLDIEALIVAKSSAP